MTIRPSSRSNGTGPARGYSRAGVTGAGSSASEQTGEGTAPTRRRRAVRYDRQRPGHQQGADSAALVPQGTRGLFTGAEEPVGDPRDRIATFFRAQQEPVGGPSDGAAASGRPQPHLNTPHIQHSAPHLNRAHHSPCLPSGERSPVGRDAPGSGSHGGASGVSGISGTSGTSEPRASREPRDPGRLGYLGCLGTHGGRGARGTSGREVLERSKRSRGDLRKTL